MVMTRRAVLIVFTVDELNPSLTHVPLPALIHMTTLMRSDNGPSPSTDLHHKCISPSICLNQRGMPLLRQMVYDSKIKPLHMNGSWISIGNRYAKLKQEWYIPSVQECHQMRPVIATWRMLSDESLLLMPLAWRISSGNICFQTTCKCFDIERLSKC